MWIWTVSAALALPPEGARLMAIGNCPAAVALATTSSAPDRLVRAACARRAGDPEGALSALTPMPDGPLRDHARFVAAAAALDAGETSDALRHLDGLVLPGALGLELRLLRGRALVQSGRSLDARDDLRSLLESGVPAVRDEARHLLAVGGRDRGETEAAINTWNRLWVQSVAGPWSDRAAAELAALGRPVPDLATAAGRALALERAEALSDARRATDALTLREAIRAQDPNAVGPRLMIRTWTAARRYAEALAGWRDLLGDPAAATGSADDLFDYALTTARTGDYATAEAIYRRLIEQHPGTTEAVTAHYKLGYMAYDAGQDARAIALLAEHVATRAGSPHRDEADWFAARAAWRSGDPATAVRGWTALRDRGTSADLVPGAKYWLGRALEASGDAAGAASAYRAVLQAHPTSGYAWFAAERVGQTFPYVPAVGRPPWPAGVAEDPEVVRFEALIAAGFPHWAAAEIGPWVDRVAASGRAGALAAAHAMIAAGAYKKGAALASPYCARPWKGGDPVAQQACTPAPEAAIVGSVAGAFDLDPLLPFAIMQAESGLDPSVTSPAGARGLMQLMPAQGDRIHAALAATTGTDPRVWSFSADDLSLAPYNAAMGTTELGLLRQSLGAALAPTRGDPIHASLPAVIASYNGGESAVRRWLSDGPPPPPDAFAEQISFTETRTYVRRVLGHLMALRWTYGDAPP